MIKKVVENMGEAILHVAIGTAIGAMLLQVLSAVSGY